jgi:hypothetical protein
MAGKTQAGYWLCNDCRDKFTCRTGTVMERSHIPVHKWLYAIHLLSSNKNGMSAHELHRMIGITYKSAWFLAHRIREAMNGNSGQPMGGAGGQVQADETFYGNTSARSQARIKHGRRARKEVVVALVDPHKGEARAFHMADGVGAREVRKIIVTNANRKSTLVSDESKLYVKVGTEFAGHQTVLHADWEYVNRDGFSTNNVENFFLSIQARNARHVHPLRAAALAALFERVLVPLFKPRWRRHWRRGACGAHLEGHRRQAPHVSTA